MDYIEKFIASEFKAQINQFKQEKGFIEDSLDFIHAIDWNESWIIGLLSFQCIFLFIVLFTRKNINIQIILFSISSILIYFAESINHLLASHWQKFSRQNYFDSDGLFLSVLLSFPLLIDLLLILVFLFYNTFLLMVKTKKKQIEYEIKKMKNAKID